MTQQTIGALVFSLIIVSFFVVSDKNISFLAERNVAQTMNGTGAFVGSSAPANVSGSGGFGSSPANPTPSTNTPAPASSSAPTSSPSATDKKDEKEKPSCSVEKEKEKEKECLARNKTSSQGTSQIKWALKKSVSESKGSPSCTYDCVPDYNARRCANGKLATTVILADGKKKEDYCPEDPVMGQSASGGGACVCPGSIGSTGRQWSQLAAVGVIAQGANQCGPGASGCGVSEVYQASVAETPQVTNPNGGGSSAGVNQGAGSAFGGQTGTGAGGSGTPGASGASGGGAGGAPASTGGSAGAGSGQGSGNTSGGGGSSAQSPTTPASPTYGGGNPVSTAPGASGNPASAPNTNASGVNTGSHYGGQGVSNYQSLQQYQPYGGNSPIAQFAQNMLGGQQPLQQELVPQQGIQSAISVSPPPRQNTVASMLRQFIQSVSGATAPAQEGVVYYQNEPIAYYRTEDGAIVIDRVRVPRQTPQGTASDPMDIAQALAVQDVSVAARIRSEVASGGITLAVPVNPNDQNQAFVNIENLIVQDEVADALRIAEEAGVSAKDTIGCEVNETAENCLARRIAAAQEIERRVFVDELNRRPLSANAVAHFIGLYDGVANSGTTVYTGSVPSILSQLNTPQQTTVVGTIVDAVGAAIDSVTGFISWMFGADN